MISFEGRISKSKERIQLGIFLGQYNVLTSFDGIPDGTFEGLTDGLVLGRDEGTH